MNRPSRISDEQIAYARRVAELKRRLLRRLRKLPTVEQLAEQIGCEARYLEKILAGHARKVPHETTVRPSIDAHRTGRANMKFLALLALFPMLALAQTPPPSRVAVIAWSAPTKCEDGDTDLTNCPVIGYRVETAASCTAATWDFLVSVGNVLTYRAVDLTAGPHCYRVKATTTAGDSKSGPTSPLPEVVVTVKRAGAPPTTQVTVTTTATVTP